MDATPVKRPFLDILHARNISQWLAYIHRADAVLTNTFHGLTFAIILRKQVVIDAVHAEKVAYIVRLFELQHRVSHGEWPAIPVNYTRISTRVGRVVRFPRPARAVQPPQNR